MLSWAAAMLHNHDYFYQMPGEMLSLLKSSELGQIKIIPMSTTVQGTTSQVK